MKIFAIIAAIIVAGFAFVALLFASSYNSLVALNELTNQQWSQVQNQYQRRADLIPNLVEVVKGVASFEKETLTAVIEARAKISQINVDIKNMAPTVEQMREFQNAQQGLGSALSRLLVVTEKYPELKANSNFTDLQVQVEGTENRIGTARRDYILAINEYNTKIQQLFFPKFAAAMLNYQPKSNFQAEAGANVAPKVSFK